MVRRLVGDVASPTGAAVVGALVLVAVLASAPLAAAAHTSLIKNSAAPSSVTLAFWVVGVAVARREPRNPIGWMLIASGALVMLGLIDAELYSTIVYVNHDALPLGAIAVVLAQCWPAALLFPPLAILLFPDGVLPSSRWRWVVWAYVASSAVLIAEQVLVGAAAVAGNDVRISHSGGYLTTPAPGVLRGPVVGALGAALLLVIVVCWVAFVARRVVSYRRATGERRQQLKWVMCGSAVTAVAIPLFAFGGGPIGLQVVGGLAIAALPISIGVGILRYRLYEIDVIIRKTLVYATLVAALALLYLGGIYAIGSTLQALTGQSSALAVTLSTLAVAAAFQPLRTRIQRGVEHRFYRQKYDAALTLQGLTGRLRDQVDLSALQSEVLDIVTLTLQPRHASLWLRAAPTAHEASPPE